MINKTEDVSINNIQDSIEDIIRHYSSEERWDSIYIFSSEGLLIASYNNSDYPEELLLEFAFTLINGANLLGENLKVKEIILRDIKKRQLIFHYVKFSEDELIIAAVSSGKKGFRRAMGRLEKSLSSIYN